MTGPNSSRTLWSVCSKNCFSLPTRLGMRSSLYCQPYRPRWSPKPARRCLEDFLALLNRLSIVSQSRAPNRSIPRPAPAS